MIFIISVIGSILIIVILVNLTFYLFPMKAPINPERYDRIVLPMDAQSHLKIESKKLEELKKPKLKELVFKITRSF